MTETQAAIIPSLDAIRNEVVEGRVSARPHRDDDRLWIFNYTPKVQFDRLWNDTNKACRGLILRLNHPFYRSVHDNDWAATAIEEVVALPWAKFFNVGEDGLWPQSPIYNVTEKMDGALGILYRIGGKYAIATRGSFHSEQAEWATAFLQSRYNLRGLPDGLTLLFEIIAPVSHVVVDYRGREDLVLLGVRDRFRGHDWTYDDFKFIGPGWGFSVVPTHDSSDVFKLIIDSHSLSVNEEGWVVRCEDGQRWKIKGDEYRKYHSLLSGLSERKVIDAMLDGTIDDLLKVVPREYMGYVTAWRDKAITEIDGAMDALIDLYKQAPRDGTRKQFAMWVDLYCQGKQPYMFALHDGRDIVPMLLKKYRERTEYRTLISPTE